MYRVGASFDAIFAEKLEQLTRLGAAREDAGLVRIGPDRARLDFLADLTRPYLEAYRVAFEAVLDGRPGPTPPSIARAW